MGIGHRFVVRADNTNANVPIGRCRLLGLCFALGRQGDLNMQHAGHKHRDDGKSQEFLAG
jgi:hypothetical protein